MILHIDATVDYAFKRVFGTERLKANLIALLNAVLDRHGARRIVDVVILNPFNPAEFRGDKWSVVDIKARDASGETFLVEIQVAAWKEILLRHMFYLAENFAGQMKEGDRYDQLKPVILIAFHVDPPFPDTDQFHFCFEMRDEKSGRLFTNGVTAHIIQLSRLPEVLTDASTPLELWSWLLMHSEELDTERIPEPLRRDPQIVNVIREFEVIARNEQEKQAYDLRLKQQRDEAMRRRHEDLTAQMEARNKLMEARNQLMEARNKQLVEEIVVRERVLVALQQEVDARRQEVDARQQEVDARQQEVDARQQEVDARQQEVDARQQEVDARQQEVDARRREIEQRGVAAGEQRGKAAGRLIGRIEALQSRLGLNEPIAEQLDGMSLDELQAVLRRLEERAATDGDDAAN